MLKREFVRWVVSFRYLLACCALVFAACGDDPKGGGDDEDPPRTLSKIDVTPVNPRLPLGIEAALTATGVYSDATTENLTSKVSWTSDNMTSVAVANDGVATAVAVGKAKITASLDGVRGSADVTATDAMLSAIAVTPINPSVPAGRDQTFAATAVFSDGTTQDVTGQVKWAASDSNAATISNEAGSRGIATGVTKGAAFITAELMGSLGATKLTVTDALLVSLEVSPAENSAPAGIGKKFTATGTFSDDTTRELTDEVTWTSSKTAVATISNDAGSHGEATGVAPGEATITATLDEISSNDAKFTVTDAVLVSITVEPVNPSVPLGLTRKFKATGMYSDGSTPDLTDTVTWESSDVAVASISNAEDSRGEATSRAPGTTTITATMGESKATTELTVTEAALETLAITPADPNLPVLLTQAFTATGTFSDGTTRDMTADVTWSSSNDEIAPISNAGDSHGVASGLQAGEVTIKAERPGVFATTKLTVTNAVLVAIAVTPVNPSIPAGRAQPLIATGTFSDDSTRDLTREVTWGSADSKIARVSNAAGSRGVATGVKVGTATVIATLFGVSGAMDLTVTDAVLVSIAVTPSAAVVAAGRTQKFIATGMFSDGTPTVLTDEVTWSSSDLEIAQVSNADGSRGETTGLRSGKITIKATLGEFSGTAELTVTDAELVSIAVSPDDASVEVDGAVTFTATGTFSDRTSRDVTAEVTWSSSDDEIARFSDDAAHRGEATGKKPGEVTITAKLGEISKTTKLTVTGPAQ